MRTAEWYGLTQGFPNIKVHEHGKLVLEHINFDGCCVTINLNIVIRLHYSIAMIKIR